MHTIHKGLGGTSNQNRPGTSERGRPLWATSRSTSLASCWGWRHAQFAPSPRVRFSSVRHFQPPYRFAKGFQDGASLTGWGVLWGCVGANHGAVRNTEGHADFAMWFRTRFHKVFLGVGPVGSWPTSPLVSWVTCRPLFKAKFLDDCSLVVPCVAHWCQYYSGAFTRVTDWRSPLSSVVYPCHPPPGVPVHRHLDRTAAARSVPEGAAAAAGAVHVSGVRQHPEPHPEEHPRRCGQCGVRCGSFPTRI